MSSDPSAPPPFEIHIVAGPNGAGKTMFAKTFLPQLGIAEFLNADLIAIGLNPLNPNAAALKAGKILLTHWRELAAQRQSFAFESTLSGRSYIKLLKDARAAYACEIHIHYLWLPSVNLCLRRVSNRVKKGGHSVPPEDIRRRYPKSIRHFLEHYRPLADKAWLWDVSGEPPSLIASWEQNALCIADAEKYEQLCKSAQKA